MRNRILRLFPHPYLLGNFIDSHDGPRMFHFQKDEALQKNALAYVLLGEGAHDVYDCLQQVVRSRDMAFRVCCSGPPPSPPPGAAVVALLPV